jgi:hypothetical protein
MTTYYRITVNGGPYPRRAATPEAAKREAIDMSLHYPNQTVRIERMPDYDTYFVPITIAVYLNGKLYQPKEVVAS